MRLFLTFFFCLFSVFVDAQQNPYIFNHLTEKNGLSNNIVYSFLKDSRGMLWVGTGDGLNLFDGSHFKILRGDKYNSLLRSTEIHSLCEDKKGRIWGGTDNGLFCYDPLIDRFTTYPVPANSLTKNVSNVYCDKHGNVWASADHSLLKFDSVAKKLLIVNVITPIIDSGWNYIIRKNGLVPDPGEHGFWLATRSGLIYYDIAKNVMKGFKEGETNPLFRRNSVSGLTKTDKGHYWFFDNIEKKIHAFDPVQQKLLFDIDVKQQLPNAIGATLFEDAQQRLWFSSWDYTVSVIEYTKNNRFIRLKRKVQDPSSIAGDFFWSAFQDIDGTVWLGTIGGISRTNPEQAIYRVINTAGFIPEIVGADIPLLAEDPLNQSWWFSTSNGHLINYEHGRQRYKLYRISDAKPNVKGQKPGVIRNIRHSNGHIVICTSSGAWEVIDQKIVPLQNFPKGYKDFVVTDMIQQGDSIYYYTDFSDILFWNKKRGQVKLKVFPENENGKPKRNRIANLKMKPEVHPSVWTFNSLNQLYEFDNTKFDLHQLINKDETTGYFTSIEIDKKGRIWACGYGQGLIRYDPFTREKKTFDQTNGLSIVHNQQVSSDDSNRIWAISFNKISVLDQRTGAFNNIRVNVDVVGTDYYTAMLPLKNGNMLTSIRNYLVEYFPEKLDLKPRMAKPLISELKVSGHTMIPMGQMMVFEPDQNSVRLHFGMITDKETFPYYLEYIMEGFDNEWQKAASDDMAVYNNLKPGDYTFRVVAKGGNGRWQSEEASIHFTISTPYYETVWFRVLVLLLVAGLIGMMYRYRLFQKTRVMKLESRAQMLEKEKAMVMYENLKQQLNPHFLFNSLTSLNSLIEAEPKAAREFLESLSKTYRYILKSRDSELVPLRDEIRFAESYIKLQKTRFEQGFEVNMDVPEEYHHRKLVPVSLQNLIENAIKHNVIDSESPLVIEIFTDGDWLVVRNNLQRKNFVETSNRTGLASMQSLYQYLSERPMEIEETQTSFIVKIPLI